MTTAADNEVKMFRFHVTHEFAMPGGPPTQAAVDQLLDRLRRAAPDHGTDVQLGIGRMHVLTTLHALDAEHALHLATTAVGAVLARRPLSVEIEPTT